MELKKCPFCGGEAEIKRVENNGKDNVWIQCKECNCATSIFTAPLNAIPKRVKLDSDYFKRVIYAWNRRYQDESNY